MKIFDPNSILDLHILVIMVLRGTEEQRKEAFNILGPVRYSEIIKAGN